MKYNVAYRKVVVEGAVEKVYTPTIGIAISSAKHISVRLDSMPIERFWKDGTLLLFPIEEKE